MQWWNKITSFLLKKSPSSKLSLPLHQTKITSEPWWGTFSLQEMEIREWTIGSHSILIKRDHNLWSTGTQQYILNIQQELTITPTLADRCLALRLEKPFVIPAYAETILYLAYPTWISIQAKSPVVELERIGHKLTADTWFGPNTREGQLCYSVPFNCTTDIANLNYQNTDIITPLYIYNESSHPLILNQLLIPTPYLSVFVDKQNHLWTEQITLKRINDEAPEIEIIKGTSTNSIQSHILCLPRLENKLGSGLQTFLLWMRI